MTEPHNVDSSGIDLTVGNGPENSSPVTFSDLPMLFLEKVVKELDLMDCLILRNVSHNLRDLVDSSEIHSKKIFFNFNCSPPEITIGDWTIEYQKIDDERCKVSSSFDGNKRKEYEVGRAYQEVLLADASALLMNPRLKIDELGFDVLTIASPQDRFLNLLEALPFQLDVQEIHIRTMESCVLPILQLLKLERLEKITLRTSTSWLIRDEMIEFTKTEQWKKATQLHWEEAHGAVQAAMLLHFKKIEFNCIKWTEENLTMVRNLLQRSTRLEECWLAFSLDRHENGRKRIARILRQCPEFDSEHWRFAIPNSRDYFQLEVDQFENIAERGLYYRTVTLYIKKVSRDEHSDADHSSDGSSSNEEEEDTDSEDEQDQSSEQEDEAVDEEEADQN